MTTSEMDTQSLAAEMRQLRSDFSRVADALREIMQQRGGDALDKAHDAAGKMWDEARKRTDGIAREIESKPMAAALGAFGLGIILGAIFGSRRS